MDFLILSGRTEKRLCTISNEADTVVVLEAKQREALNKEHTFLFRIDATHEDARHVEKGNLIGFLDRDDESFFHLFKIIDVDDDHADAAERIAECLYWPTELADEHVEDFRPTNTTARYAMEKAVEGTRVKVGIVGDLGINSTNFYREKPLSCFEKIIAKWGGELRFRVIIDGNGIVDRFADLLPRRGSNKGDRLEYAHNIEKIERRESIRDVKTALRGYGRGEESGDGYGRRIDFKDVEWSIAKGDPMDKPRGQDWIGDEEAKDLYGAPNGDGTFRHKFGQFEDSEIEDPAELLQRTYEALQLAKQPFLNYRLNPVILEGEKYELGDTLVVIDDDINPPIQIQSRIIVHERDLLEEDNDVIEVGQFNPLITDVDDRIEKVIAKVNDRSGVWDNPPTKEITDTQFPDIIPPVPIEISTVGLFKTIKINWRYFTDSYIAAYEVYASRMQGFVPQPEDLIFRGKTSGILFEAGEVNQQWYFRIRTINYHGSVSAFSDEFVANTVTINGEREITPLTITNELIAEDISADKINFGTMDGQKVKVINLDADNIVGGDLELTRGLRVTHNGQPVVEVRDGQVRITAPNVATKKDLEEIELTPGPQGPQGPKGDQGSDGKGITGTTVTYQLHTSGVIAPTGTWSNSPPTPVKGRYLWTRTVISFSDSSSSTTYSVSYLATDGQSGQDGKGVQSTSVRYQLHTNGTSAPSGTWLEIPPAPIQGRYLWTRTIIYFTDDTHSISYSTSYFATDGQKGDKGDLGPQGIQGPAGSNGSSQYVHIRYSANANGSNMTTSPQSNTAYIGLANTTSATAPASNTAYTWALFKGPEGGQGIQGPKGDNGQTTYTWVKYADEEDGTGISDTPSGKMYIGLAFNKTTQTESNNPSDYTWSAMYDLEALNDKAEVTDMDNLAEIVSSVSSELNFKAGMGEFEALEQAFNARVEQDILDKEQLIADLATIEGRTALMEILAGENKLVTEFIETVITQSEEGIFVGNESTDTGILISDNRISFVDHGREVAYISNQTMQISHGIFVESATISDFKFEKIPGTSILAITWVGD